MLTCNILRELVAVHKYIKPLTLCGRSEQLGLQANLHQIVDLVALAAQDYAAAIKGIKNSKAKELAHA